MKRIIVLTLLLFSFNFCNSQDLKKLKLVVTPSTLKFQYFDEHMKKISHSEYLQRSKSFLLSGYDISDIKNINSNIRKYGIYFAHDFGTIEPFYLKQIKDELTKSSGEKILPNETIIIRYNNNLYSKESVVERLTSGPVHKSKAIAKRKIKKWRVDIKKGIKSLEKRKDAKLFFVYANDLGGKNDYPRLKLNWIEDTMNLGNSLFKIKYTHHLIVIRPSGEYFISHVHLASHLLKKVLNEKDWSKLKKGWKEAYHSMSPYGNRIFGSKLQTHNILCRS